MNNLDPKGEYAFMLQELKATNSKNKTELYKTIRHQIEAIDNISPVGGLLHVVLDDYNVRDVDLNWCINYINNSNDPDKQLYLDCANNLLKLTEEERLYIITNNFIME